MEKQQVEISGGALQTRVDVSPGFLHDLPLDGRQTGSGLRVERYFSVAETDPLDTTHWERRDAMIGGEGGKVYFEQRDVEVPKGWTQMATNVVAQKYFRGAVGTEDREGSVRQLIDRVTRTIARWGTEQRYFADERAAETFRCELNHLLVTQRAAFNSPVWFNVGVEESPQCSACFINKVDDTMESILGLAKTEGMLFKWGSGTGTNFSAVRSSSELLSGGGTASGPVSFMRGFDAFAGVIKSGGKTRRAAKMVILNADHPDIEEYVSCKSKEEQKAWALIDAGYDGSFDGEAYDSVFFQNSNNSVRVTDEFMEAAIKDRAWRLRAVTSGEVVATIRGKDLLRQISEAAHLCGDPGLQFDTTVNAWHTCPASGRINASNPCSEYMFLDNSACNLASLNLRKFQGDNGALDIEAFRRAVGLLVLAQEILVDNAKYPTEEITINSHKYRPLGLGYANLGALLMSRGLPYDSDAGRAYAAAVTSLMHGEANRASARIASDRGPFEAYNSNAAPMLGVMDRHRRHLDLIDAAYVPYDLMEATRQVWDEVIEQGTAGGFRNAQVTVLAPTGTIGFMMDCDTTGIEPDIALVKYKKLVGGGTLKMVNGTVPEALSRLGYGEGQVEAIIDHIEQHDTIEGAPDLKEEHLPVFDCAFRPQKGERLIPYMGHVRMMSAVQSFLSGAISKTVNMPAEATVDEIEDAYIQAWRLGLKAIAIYRDGCKRVQPLTISREEAGVEASTGEIIGPPEAVRHKLADERQSVTHKFSVGGQEGYLTVGMYEDGQPGEIFVSMAKEGSTISGLMDSFAKAISLALQHGVPLELLVDKFAHTRFEPSGFSQHPKIGYAKSIMDYIFRWLRIKFSEAEQGEVAQASPSAEEFPLQAAAEAAYAMQLDAPPCPECGGITRRSGSCYLCASCGSTTGCS
jgi:ribonucleoside-diphosphate reductase alpha chain